MPDQGCTVTIDGNYGGTYYTSCSSIQYIEDGSLFNIGSSTITLYPQKSNQNYPRISIPSNSYPRYYANSSTSYVELTNISRTDFNIYSQIYRYNERYSSIIISFMLIFLCMYKVVKR